MKTKFFHFENFDFINELEPYLGDINLRLYGLKHDLCTIIQEFQTKIPDFKKMETYHLFLEFADMVAVMEHRNEVAQDVAKFRKVQEAYDTDRKHLEEMADGSADSSGSATIDFSDIDS